MPASVARMEFLSAHPPVDLLILCLAAFAAGAVRGFTGFGTALIYLPMAAIILDPVSAIVTLVIMDLAGPVPVLAKTAKDTHPPDLGRLLAGVVVALPLGLMALFVLDPSVFRFLVSTVALIMLAGLVLGWRYQGQLRPRAVVGTGMAAGFLGGVAGLPGPPVIFFYMASTHPARVIRANTLFFLYGYDWIMLVMLAVAGRLESGPMLIGLGLIVPSMAGVLLGAWMFRPGYEKTYRAAAYFLIFCAAITGLPFWNMGH